MKAHRPPSHPRPRRIGALAVATSALVLATATPALAHTEVSASDSRALAKDVTLTFESEAEDGRAGFTEIRTVLPTGIDPGDVRLKQAPKGWKLKPTDDGYSVGGPALAPGENAEHSFVVRQLPDATSLEPSKAATSDGGSAWPAVGIIIGVCLFALAGGFVLFQQRRGSGGSGGSDIE
uniref:Uncharacterized protein merF-2 n=1 Tax=Streptomyces sp. NRRL 30748 TaxID=367779 RepID=Q1WEK3_9ACTN|nr:unknown [Streptomyces sp. NRRL 30748]